MRKSACAALGASLLFFSASPAMADELFAVTPSGAAEMLFPEKPPVVIGKLSSKCIDAHWTVISSSATELVCEAPLNFGQSVLGQMLLGNSYSTPPRRFFRFNIAELNGVSRVQVSGWMELQMAFGQTKRTDFAGPEFENGMMNFMASVGGKYPVGTTFPNHVMMGVQGDDVPEGKYHGLRVTSVEPGSPAAKAGMQVGDVVEQIAHKRFKGGDDYLDATAKAAASPTYDVQVLRSGKTMVLSLERAFRPAITEAVVAIADNPTTTVAPAPRLPALSDELAKLMELKEQGALTEAEFEAAKRKLLAQ